MKGYVPGLQLNYKVIKLNTNENPYPLPDFLIKAIQDFVKENIFHLYPDPESKILREKLAKIYKKNKENILIGNGSDEILSIVFRGFLQKGDRILILDPSYSLYPVLAEALQVDVISVPLKSDFTVDLDLVIHHAKLYQPKLLVITNPNAPTGIAMSRNEILFLYNETQLPMLVDEAYVFFGGETIMYEAGSEDYPLLMACSTFSKAFSSAGLRLGWLIANPVWIKQFDKIRDSYNINIFTQKVGEMILNEWDYFHSRIQEIIQTREWFIEKLKDLNFFTLPSKTNFVFTSPPDQNAQKLYEKLLTKNILVRYFSQIPAFLRITIGTKEQMEVVYEEIYKIHS
ncbi:MAG: histidinol-phosphate transaminase [Leptospiraceae bacterium]|nr:histidinol-phosphate transaminase [Leptospiraceae bacterium]